MEEVVDSLQELVLSENEMESMYKTFNNLINSKNVKEIKGIFDLLPEKSRYEFIYAFDVNKNLMFQACFSKATEIVEYFIERCRADVNKVIKLEDETLTVLFIAIKTGNIDLVHLLLNKDADIDWEDSEHRSAIVYACHLNKMEAAYALKYRGANINSIKNQELCAKNLSYLKRALKLGTDINYVNEFGTTILMKAVDNEEIDVIKLLLKEKVDIYLRSYYYGMNALDVAHWLKKDDVLAYFKQNSVYSLADKVLSYELCGAMIMVITQDIDEAENFWKISTRLRKKYSATIGILIKEIPALIISSDLYSDENDSDTISLSNRINMALRVICRIVEINHPFVHHAFIMAAYNKKFCDDLDFCKVKAFINMNSTSEKPVCTGVFIVMTGAITMCEKQLLENNKNFENTVLFIRSIVNFITEDVFPILSQFTECQFTFKNYKQMMLMLLHLIDSLLEEECSENRELDESIEKIVKIYTPNFPTSMLLIAIERGFPFKTVVKLVACGADVNAKDYIRNSPLHLIGAQPDHFPEKNKIRELLIQAGAEVDAHNDFKETPSLSLFEM